MTLRHDVNLDTALEAQEHIIEIWWPKTDRITLLVQEIYLLHRQGDNCQFVRLASLGLGATGEVTVHDTPPHCFNMPKTECEKNA
jgi:hypothetical protein